MEALSGYTQRIESMFCLSGILIITAFVVGASVWGLATRAEHKREVERRELLFSEPAKKEEEE